MSKTSGFSQEEVLAATTALLVRLVRVHMSDVEAAKFILDTANQMRAGAKSRLHKGAADWLEHRLLPEVR